MGRYDPPGKESLLESVYALYNLEQATDESISSYMSRARQLFRGIHSVTLNTIENLFIIVNSDCSQFGALTDRFRASDPEVVNTDVDRLKTLL